MNPRKQRTRERRPKRGETEPFNRTASAGLNGTTRRCLVFGNSPSSRNYSSETIRGRGQAGLGLVCNEVDVARVETSLPRGVLARRERIVWPEREAGRRCARATAEEWKWTIHSVVVWNGKKQTEEKEEKRNGRNLRHEIGDEVVRFVNFTWRNPILLPSRRLFFRCYKGHTLLPLMECDTTKAEPASHSTRE